MRRPPYQPRTGRAEWSPAAAAPGHIFPASDEATVTEATVRCADDLVEAFRARKEQLGLSNEAVEAQLLMAAGTCDKYLGPSRTLQLIARVFEDLMTLLGVELVMRVNPELEAKMRDRYERRDERSVRQQRRLSRQLMDVATAQFYERLSKLGNEARKVKLPAEARSRIARAAAVCRWQRHRAAVKAASASEGARA
jgi:hypothetical protein